MHNLALLCCDYMQTRLEKRAAQASTLVPPVSGTLRVGPRFAQVQGERPKFSLFGTS